MLDRAVGIAGLALTLIFWALPYFAPQVPSWVSKACLAVGLLLLGMVAGLFVSDRRNAVIPQPVDTALLRLHMYGDDRIPDRLAEENIFRWYYLKTFIVASGAAGQLLKADGFGDSIRYLPTRGQDFDRPRALAGHKPTSIRSQRI
jgi:hypothetical protein